MAITATYKDNAITVENAYIRVGRMWGSKNEGWNCWVEIYANEGDTEPAAPTFSANAPYVEGENPFTALYRAIEALPFIITKEEASQLVLATEKAKLAKESILEDEVIAAVKESEVIPEVKKIKINKTKKQRKGE